MIYRSNLKTFSISSSDFLFAQNCQQYTKLTEEIHTFFVWQRRHVVHLCFIGETNSSVGWVHLANLRSKTGHSERRKEIKDSFLKDAAKDKHMPLILS